MEKKLKIFQIVVWSLVTIFLIGLLVSFTQGNEARNRFFPLKGMVFSFDGRLEETQNQTFTVSDIERIDMDCTTADIYIKETDGDEIRVIVKSSKEAEEQTIFIDRENKTLHITQKEFEKFFAFYNTNQVIEIELPQVYRNDLKISDNTGDIDFSGTFFFEKVNLSTSTGDVCADSLNAGQLILSGSTGNVTINSLNADNYSFGVSTANITIGNLAGCGKIKSSTGNIQAGILSLSGDVDISSNTGNVDLKLAEQINARIATKTSTGRIESDFPTYLGEISKRATGEIGNTPLYDLTVSTSTGDISLNKSLTGYETEEKSA